MPRTQHTPVDVGQFKEMVKGVVSRLPTEFVDGAYPTTEPAWYHERVAELLRLPRNSDEAAQIERILANGALTAAILANQYADEKVVSRLVLPAGYIPAQPEEVLARELKWLEAQSITDLHPHKVSEYAEKWGNYAAAHGFCVVPKPSLLAHRLGVEDPKAWGLLTEKGPIAVIAAQRKLKNWREGQMGPDYWDIEPAAEAAFAELEEMQPEGGFIVFPICSGWVVDGYNLSPRNARVQVENAKSPRMWPVPSYAGLWYVFGNPSRITMYEDLCMNFIGDRVRLEPGRAFGNCSSLDFYDGQLDFDDWWIDDANESFASVVGFLP